MPSAPIIPDGQIIFLPFKSHLRIVILRHKVDEVIQKEVGFIFRNAVNSFGEAFVDKHRFPAGDRCVLE